MINYALRREAAVQERAALRAEYTRLSNAAKSAEPGPALDAVNLILAEIKDRLATLGIPEVPMR